MALVLSTLSAFALGPAGLIPYAPIAGVWGVLLLTWGPLVALSGILVLVQAVVWIVGVVIRSVAGMVTPVLRPVVSLGRRTYDWTARSGTPTGGGSIGRVMRVGLASLTAPAYDVEMPEETARPTS